VLPHGISFAIGALLAVSFWGLIPHALKKSNRSVSVRCPRRFGRNSDLFRARKAADLAALSLQHL